MGERKLDTNPRSSYRCLSAGLRVNVDGIVFSILDIYIPHKNMIEEVDERWVAWGNTPLVRVTDLEVPG
jgi:hypothetical protein